MTRFLNKQLSHAENKKLGRPETHFEFSTDGGMSIETRRASARTKPPLVTTEEFPVGRSRAIKKPR